MGYFFLNLPPVETLRGSSANHNHSYTSRLHSLSPSLKHPSLVATSFPVCLSKTTLLQPKRNQIKIQLLFRKTKLRCIFAPALCCSCGGGCARYNKLVGDYNVICMKKDIREAGLLFL
ncbi:hypothetical protein CHARACLAT_018450 [Characodon lateralis]|uniref:Uncharacterized protein n=1 Tax=Characodon lateralis TaxID=208331 RepID=A0ABU7E1L0_9TELE|nr:hypothetical protein [Characodon lateralis]